MLLSGNRIQYIVLVIVLFSLGGVAQEGERELGLKNGGTIDIVNHYGRVSAKTETSDDVHPFGGLVKSVLPAGIPTTAIKTTGGAGRVVISVEPLDKKVRIDVVLILPERTTIRVKTLSGAVEIAGNFASIDVTTDTGTVAVDVPSEDLKYHFVWTESKPRYLADFPIAPIKERAAGRFEIKGRQRNGEVKKEKEKVDSVGTDPESKVESPRSKRKRSNTKSEKSSTVLLQFTTARGIILLNVPPNEVMSDLRERPLTNAAKAIIRSGDSLLMEAIRRASPKYFGDYARTLPPFQKPPSLRDKSGRSSGSFMAVKTALVRVTDTNNRAIADLGAVDFEVIENGRPREVMSVERAAAPFNLVLLLDVSGSVENYVNFIRKAARSFVETVDKNDRVSIVIFNEDVKVLSKFTTDKSKLSESLDTFDAGGGTAYYDALAYTIADTLRPLKGERTAIVILTDGDDNRSFLAFDSMLGSIQESGALIYPLYVPSGLIAAAAANPKADIDPMRAKYMSLTAKSKGEGERLAKVSGGVYYPITQISQIQAAYEDIVVQMRSAYNIKFRSEIAGDNVGRLKIRARRENTFITLMSVAVGQP